VEADAHERPDAGTELPRQLVRERAIERQQRPVDADLDRTFEDVEG
jgi:hypothetical protein